MAIGNADGTATRLIIIIATAITTKFPFALRTRIHKTVVRARSVSDGVTIEWTMNEAGAASHLWRMCNRKAIGLRFSLIPC